MAKRQKTLKKENVGVREDRISQLPMHLLVSILSFLPLVDAVRCSVLSSNWRKLWSSPTLIDLEKSDPDDVLRIHKFPNTETFMLTCRTAVGASKLRNWLGFILLHNVREIHFDLVSEKVFTLPRKLFTCNTLASIKLKNKIRISLPCYVKLPNLKIFHITLYNPTNAITNKLFCNCPLLEDLEICSSVNKYKDIIFDIASPVLRRLKLDLHTDDDFTDEVVHLRNKIVINAPVLEDIEVRDDYLANYSFQNLSSLVSACIDVGICCMQALGTEEHAAYLISLLEGVTNVKYLTLQPQTMGVLDSMVGIELPLFNNLKHLVVFVYNCYQFERFWDLLGNAPNLLTLELIRDFVHEDTVFEYFNWREPPRRPASFLSHLEQIEIFGFKGLKCELALLKYLLKNAKELKKVNLNSCYLSKKKQRHFLRQLAKFKKGLKTCKFEIIPEFRSLI